MPFIGRDWRANGEQWTKTDIGSWELPRRTSLSTSVSYLISYFSLNYFDLIQPINVNTSLSDIFNALDIANSVSNIRRFNYITKVVQILFKEKLGELSGNAQRSLFQVVEQMINMGMYRYISIDLLIFIDIQFLKLEIIFL